MGPAAERLQPAGERGEGDGGLEEGVVEEGAHVGAGHGALGEGPGEGVSEEVAYPGVDTTALWLMARMPRASVASLAYRGAQAGVDFAGRVRRAVGRTLEGRV